MLLIGTTTVAGSFPGTVIGVVTNHFAGIFLAGLFSTTIIDNYTARRGLDTMHLFLIIISIITWGAV